MTRATTIMLAAAALLCLLTACESQQKKEEEKNAALISTPLPHDPTDEFEIARWWSNGAQLLRLEPDASYALYVNTNRYDPPLERGRWSQQSYAVMWLEPYRQLRADPVRVTITKIDGRLALKIPRFEPMFALQAPPPAPQDQLIGEWISGRATLRLGANMRYALAQPESGATPISAGHNGVWSIEGDKLMLSPDLGGVDPIALTIKIDDEDSDAVTLSGADGEWTRKTAGE